MALSIHYKHFFVLLLLNLLNIIRKISCERKRQKEQFVITLYLLFLTRFAFSGIMFIVKS